MLGRLYAGQGMDPGQPPPVDSARDQLLMDLILTTSRDFDFEVTKDESLIGLFGPIYEVRLFSGAGKQKLAVDPFGLLIKVEMNSSPGAATATWLDYTAELSNYKMAPLPVRGYPKQQIFRQAAFWQDPFPTGNVRLTAVWGHIQSDPTMAHPVPTWQGVTTQGAIDALAPPNGGWWVTLDDVREAVAGWVTYKFQAAKTSYSAQPGPASTTGGQNLQFPSDVPIGVQRVVRRYGAQTELPKFGLISTDGSEASESPWRWAGWVTSS